jgi:ornithine decarboxylase
MLAPDTGRRARMLAISPKPQLRLVEAPDRPVPEDVRAISPKIARYFATTPLAEPTLVMDLDIVDRQYRRLADAFAGCRVHYAVKANPAPEVLDRLVAQGSAFDCASLAEIEQCLDRGARAADLCFGNTVKREREIARAWQIGVPLFAFDSIAELRKIARAAPGARVFARLFTDGAGADWPLSRKFGCVPDEAAALLIEADALGLEAAGVSFHVGSQQTDPTRWLPALQHARRVFDLCDAAGVRLSLIDLGGGMPARLRSPIGDLKAYGDTVMGLVREQFGGRPLELMIEPGRGMVADAGVIQAEIVLVSERAEIADRRWVYLDIGKFSGLAETIDEAIKYRLLTMKDGGATAPVVVAGPTCDSADVLYEKSHIEMPVDLADGDKVWIPATGCYTTSYSAVGFNGFPPLASVYL